MADELTLEERLIVGLTRSSEHVRDVLDRWHEHDDDLREHYTDELESILRVAGERLAEVTRLRAAVQAITERAEGSCRDELDRREFAEERKDLGAWVRADARLAAFVEVLAMVRRVTVSK